MKAPKIIIVICTVILFGTRCTKLHETIDGNLTAEQIAKDSASAAVLLQAVYASLEFTFTSYQQIFALSDISTDEAIVPTRGNNWDDNGIWRVLHLHKWDGNSIIVTECFNSLGGVIYAATDMLQYNATVMQKAEARFLRAWAMYWMLDLFDQVPYRDPGESVIQPARVRKGMDAYNYILNEITTVMTNLPEGALSVARANKDAARVLLMKCYLNKAVYTNRAAPVFPFDAEDMNRVISLADEIITGASNTYKLSDIYFDNFSPVNATTGTENIFTQASNNDGQYLVSFAWLAPLGYLPQYGGFNGFTTLSNFYNKFEPGDKRRGQVYSYPNSPPNPAQQINVGFLIGRQYDIYTGDPTPVNYTPEVKIIEPGPDLNNPGIRPIKYAPDYSTFYFWDAAASNQFVYFRLPDVLLMKAEAILRGGTSTNTGPYGGTPTDIVNYIRTHPSRNATRLPSVDPNIIFDERGRELWWENWRRQDMIRFGKFLLPFQEKDYQSDPKCLVYPIPNEALAVNPTYLKQNPGY